MPEIQANIDVEVFCAECGNGLCNDTIVKGHQYPQLHVGLCPKCMEKRDEEVNELKERIEELEEQLKCKEEV